MVTRKIPGYDQPRPFCKTQLIFFKMLGVLCLFHKFREFPGFSGKILDFSNLFCIFRNFLVWFQRNCGILKQKIRPLNFGGLKFSPPFRQISGNFQEKLHFYWMFFSSEEGIALIGAQSFFKKFTTFSKTGWFRWNCGIFKQKIRPLSYGVEVITRGKFFSKLVQW